MGKIYAVMGKSSTGKDTIYKRLLEQKEHPLKQIVTYTTRPMRSGEKEGVEYHFRTIEELEELRKANKVIEEKCFHTVHGDWYYFTVDDGQVDFEKDDDYLIVITTLGRFSNTRKHYGEENVVPLYIEVETGLRLERALQREKQQKEPKYLEMCRRFLADEEDFPDEKIVEVGIRKRYQNHDLEMCINEILSDMNKQ